MAVIIMAKLKVPSDKKLLADLRRRDEKRAMDFLVGVIEYDKNGLPFLEYLSDESKAGRAGRASLVRLLLHQELSADLCCALATLFDNSKAFDRVFAGPHINNHTWARFPKIEFKPNRLGAPSKAFQNSEIARRIWDDIAAGAKPEMAKKRAAEKYGKSEEAIKSILREWRTLRPPG
jgi:hypothetical protein